MKFTSLSVVTLFLLSSVVRAQDADFRQKQFNLDDGVAIHGYDAVAYMKQGKAVKGKKELNASYQGVTYYFSSAANKEEFVKSPSKYEPEYGGWCAFAMGAKGEKVAIDPATFKVVNGKLYLF